MARSLPTEDRLLLEEAVRLGLIGSDAATEAVARWESENSGEAFPMFLVRTGGLDAAGVSAAAQAAAARLAPSAGTAEGRSGAGNAEVIKGYRILERLGRGGMGSVYRAVQTGMNRVVALKILRRPLAQDENQIERLRREARLVGGLDHPNIVRGLDVGQSGPYHYFAMEFVEGETLRDRLQRGPMAEAEALRIIEQVADALDHAHARGVIHRDVKPGNIMLTPEGIPKVTDFGLAKGPADFSLTQSGVTIGTPQYISPEQARDPSAVDGRTDLYSLGATAYHMLAGVPPHGSETLAGLLTKVLYERPRTARQVNPRVSTGASFLVEKLMAKKQHHRYATPQEVLRDLRRLAAGRSIVPRDWTGDFEVQEVKRRFRTLVAAGAVIVVGALATVVAVSFTKNQEALRLREDVADRDLRELQRTNTPRDEAGWHEFDQALAAFQSAHAGTQAVEVANGLRTMVQRRVAHWRRAGEVRDEARALADAGRFKLAVERLDRGIAALQQSQDGDWRQAADFLDGVRSRFRQDGIEAAEDRVRKDLDLLARAAAGEGAAASAEAHLRASRDFILAEMVESPSTPPVDRIDRVLDGLLRVRADIEDSKFGEGFEAELEADLREMRFRSAEEKLFAVQRSMESDSDLQLLLAGLPPPAAQDYLHRAARRRARVRAANALANAETMDRASDLAAAGNYEEAISLLSAASQWSVDDLRKEPEALQATVRATMEETEREMRTRVERFFEQFIGYLSRRDYWGARRLLDAEESGLTESPPRGTMHGPLTASRLLLDLIDSVAFERFRRKVREGAPALAGKGLRFDEDDRIPYPQISAVRIEQTGTGEVVVFDSTGFRNLRRTLARIHREYLFHYAGLDGSGLAFEEALVRGALVVADGGEDLNLGIKELEDAATLLKRARDGMPGIGPIVDALLERQGELVRLRLDAAEDQEKDARDYFKRAVDALEERRPKDARVFLDLLRKPPLSGTRVVKERRNEVDALNVKATAMQKEQRLEGLYSGAEVREDPLLDFTTATFDFNRRVQMSALVPPEDSGPPFYDIRMDAPDPAAGEGAPPEGYFVWVRPPATAGPDGRRREIYDSPLVTDLPFKIHNGITVSFKYRSESPYFLMVSIAGNNIGILNDDGRKESGRGVAAWQSEDWRNPDEAFSDLHRHGYVTMTGVTGKEQTAHGLRYYQFEPGRDHFVQVKWEQGRMRLYVDGQEIWNQDLPKGRYFSSKPPRLRIVTYTPARLDDLEIRGMLDEVLLRNLLR